MRVKVESSAEAKEVWWLKKKNKVSLTIAELICITVNRRLTANFWQENSWSETVKSLIMTK